jgi:WhiB family redox-sensing transcriptional regulator
MTAPRSFIEADHDLAGSLTAILRSMPPEPWPVDRTWMDRARCAGAVTSPDDDVFFPADREPSSRESAAEAAERERAALGLCAECPVQVSCLAYAVATRQPCGVWGGLPEAQVQALVTLLHSSQSRPAMRLRTGARGSRGVAGSDSFHARKTRCPAGHPYDTTNTYVNARGARQCRTCMRARALAQQAALVANRTHCPAGHVYDEVNTHLDTLGRRRCRTCRRAPGASGTQQRSRNSSSTVALEGGRS